MSKLQQTTALCCCCCAAAVSRVPSSVRLGKEKLCDKLSRVCTVLYPVSLHREIFKRAEQYVKEYRQQVCVQQLLLRPGSTAFVH